MSVGKTAQTPTFSHYSNRAKPLVIHLNTAQPPMIGAQTSWQPDNSQQQAQHDNDYSKV